MAPGRWIFAPRTAKGQTVSYAREGVEMSDDASLAPEPFEPGTGEPTGHSTPPRATTVRLVVAAPEEKADRAQPAGAESKLPAEPAPRSQSAPAGRQRAARDRKAEPRRPGKAARTLEGTIAILGGAVLVVIALSRLLPSSFGAVPVLPAPAPVQTSATPT